MSDLVEQVIEPETEALLLRLETPTRKDVANGTTLVYTPDSDVLWVCAAYRRQHARIKALEAGLDPFAFAARFTGNDDDSRHIGYSITSGDLRRAASLLEPKK